MWRMHSFSRPLLSAWRLASQVLHMQLVGCFWAASQPGAAWSDSTASYLGCHGGIQLRAMAGMQCLCRASCCK